MLKEGKDLKTFHMLSIPLIILGIFAAFGGLFFDWLYNDPYEVLVQAIAQDTVTLFVITNNPSKYNIFNIFWGNLA